MFEHVGAPPTLLDALGAPAEKVSAKIEDRVLTRAADQSVGQFSASVRRAVIAADPRLAEQRHEDALAERCVVITSQRDGVAELCALLPAEGAALIKTVLDSLATVKTPGETRTADQRRADCLVDVFARVLGDPSLPEHHGRVASSPTPPADKSWTTAATPTTHPRT
jgi:hypothetical protein